jgi:phytoene/squalene synthetase
VSIDELLALRDSERVRALIADLVGWARELMLSGAPLARTLPGRAGWELRLVIQGGLRILDKIDALEGATLLQRPRISRRDAPLLAWRAIAMSRAGAAESPGAHRGRRERLP